MPIITVTHHWDDAHGPCYECGDPAAFVAPDMYGPDQEPNASNLLCAVCAAQQAASGERIFRLWVDDSDPPISTEHVEILAKLGITV